MDNQINISEQRIWMANLGQTILLSPELYGETLLFATQKSSQRGKHSNLQAINITDGSFSWEKTFDYALVSGIQAYHLMAEQADIAVVTTSSSNFLKGDGGVYAFNQKGEIVWQWQGKDKHYSDPVVQDRQVFVIAGGEFLSIISPEEEGDSERRIPLSVAASLASPAIHHNIAYIPCRRPELLAVDLNGTVRWLFQFESTKRDWLDKTPLVVGEHIYTVSSLGNLFAIDRESGTLLWQVSLGNGRSVSQPAFAKNHLYVGTHQGMTVIDAVNGRTSWIFNTPRPVATTPLIVENNAYISCEDHNLYAIDLTTTKEIWQLNMNRRLETPPLLTPKALIVADRGGTIVALKPPDVSEEEAQAGRNPMLEPDTIQAQQQVTATIHAQKGNHLAAAKIWHDCGNLEKAAQEYEHAKEWLTAAELWMQLDRYGKRAHAYEQHARLLSKNQIEDEEKAVAWDQAARAYIETGQKDERQKCEREVHRYRRQPIIKLEIEPEKMIINNWSKLNFTVRNDGFGIARFVYVTLKEGRFEGRSGRTKTTPTLIPGNEFSYWLDIYPRQHGTRVPLRLIIEYTDKSSQVHILERSFPLEVAAESSIPTTDRLSQTPTPLEDTDPMVAQLPDYGDYNLTELRNKINQYFSIDDIRALCLDLGIDPDSFGGKKSRIAIDLVLYHIRRNKFKVLIDKIKSERPNIDW